MFEIIEKYNYWQNEEVRTGYVRKQYVNKISGYLKTNLVKVIIGQRRVGKSYLMRMMINYLIKEFSVPSKNILYINKEMIDLDFIKTSQDLANVVEQYKKKLKPKGDIYIFLDEIQEIENWEKIVNSLSQEYKEKYEIFISGSNANLLSTELATYLTGRHINFEIFPFSFEEFTDFKQLENDKTALLQYLKNGGIPETFHLPEEELIRNYISSLKDSILLKDIVKRHNIRDIDLLDRLSLFLIDNIGCPFSINKITNQLKSMGYKSNCETIGNYINYLTETFFFHEVQRYDLKGKRILSGERKYYLNDFGFKYFLSSNFDFEIGKYLENLVFLHLKRNGYNVTIGQIGKNEIDFVAEKNKDKIYIQVCYLLASQEVVDREFGNLELIHNHYEKVVLSMDDILMGNKKGIKHKQIWTFLGFVA